MEAKSELSEEALLLLVAFLLVNAPNCHPSLVLALVQWFKAMQSTVTRIYFFFWKHLKTVVGKIAKLCEII